ncbi:MAG: FtsW/RodA/SpoVE family cell cycle protein [Bacteroidales bacterium]|nr:FtsW/RodA/SpoVE family cell cycle protein [Bacteroidales bacterium]
MKLRSIFRGDVGIWVVFFLLSLISLAAVYSSIGLEAYSHRGPGPTGWFLKHLGIVALTYLAIIGLSRINYRYFARFAVLGYWASLVLLVVLMALGKRWLVIPGMGQFQPSEIAKVMLIIFIARMIALKKEKTDDLATFIQLLFYIALVAGFVLPENFSTAALIFLACYLMMYLGGVNKKYWWRLFLVGVVIVVGFLAVSYYKYEKSQNNIDTKLAIERQETWGHRVYSWVNPQPDELTQENMARMAIARGGIIGKRVGNTIHGRLMTQAHNDFIYAIIIEETGFVGGMIVFILYGVFYLRCLRLAKRCDGKFGQLTVAGIGTVIYLQALVNMSVAVGALPVTGQTLPFISYGGTAYLFLGCGVGVIQAVAADVDNKKSVMATDSTEKENELQTEE